jgi:hypothetical protein
VETKGAQVKTYASLFYIFKLVSKVAIAPFFDNHYVVFLFRRTIAKQSFFEKEKLILSGAGLA